MRQPAAAYDDPVTVVDDRSVNNYSTLKDEVVFSNNFNKWYYNGNTDDNLIIVQNKASPSDDTRSVTV